MGLQDAMGCDRCGADRGECIHTAARCDPGCTVKGWHYDCVVPKPKRVRIEADSREPKA